MNITYKNIIRRFTAENLGEFLVVTKAEGITPWGKKIRAEHTESGDIMIYLPDDNEWILALLDNSDWEIWIHPKNAIHVVRPDEKNKNNGIPYEYIMLTDFEVS